ncbi:MAG: histidine phosphatase [Oleiphilus sp.]|nr:MAG: histidine phosphatase [Oleiphilus sp.]
MSNLLLVRHGQASFGHQNYDQLSELGRRQSRWLGEYLRDTELAPELILRGDLERHKQTAEMLQEGLGQSVETIELPLWNEFDFKAIAYAYLAEHPDKAPQSNDTRTFFALLKQALLSWSDGTLKHETPESWQAFDHRISKALDETCQHTDLSRVLVVSSGGAISMAIGKILQLSASSVIDLNLQTRNTGLSEVFFNTRHRYLTSFNHLPHMNRADRLASVTSA